VADLVGCPKITVTKRLERGKLPSFRLGKYGRERTGKHIILAEDAARFISEYRMYKTLKASDAVSVQS